MTLEQHMLVGQQRCLACRDLDLRVVGGGEAGHQSRLGTHEQRREEGPAYALDPGQHHQEAGQRAGNA